MAKKKQEVKLKEPVRIRFKQLANGNQSIYLDYYTGDVIRKENYVGGKRQYEFLKLYLIPEKTREDKAKNEATLALAKAIQSKRIVELQNDAHGFQNTNKSKANVIDYLMNMRSQSKERGSLNYEKTVGNTIRELKLFRGDYIAFRDIDKDFLNSFVDFLKQAKKASKFGLLKAGGVLSNNSVIAYYGVLRTAINRAYKEGIITVNPTKEFDFASKVKAEVSRREYLTIEELKRLIGTECKYEIMKQAFLFSCLCGLRVSDIRKLKWNDLQKSGERIRIEIKMQKTKEPLYLPISDEALKWLPQQNEAKGDDLIFPLTHEGTINKILQKWAKDAGVIKHISFHTVRHYLAILKKTCRIAFKAGHSERYHFMHFKLPQKKENPPKALTREDFLKIRDLEIPERRKSLALTRDLFLFACYTGTAYADTVSITEENLFRDEEGSLWLKYHRKKNKMLARVKLLPEALAMLEKYKDPTRPTLLPPQEFRVLRGNMKSLRVLSGISMDLVYHVGRHSFASLVTLEEGVPIETISKMLGHSNIQTTQIYARVTPKKLFEDMDKFIEANKDFKFVL